MAKRRAAASRLAGALADLALRRWRAWRARAHAPAADAPAFTEASSSAPPLPPPPPPPQAARSLLSRLAWPLARASVLVLGGAAAGVWLSERLRPPLRGPRGGAAAGAAAADSPEATAIMGGAAPSLLFRRVSQNFVAEFDSATRNPRWVIERLGGGASASTASADGGGGASRAHHVFREDKGLPPELRARLADYEGSGYDRGHLAPAADNRASEAAMHDSFLLTNVSPQVGAGFNRDYWARLEAFVRVTARRFPGDTFVCTGPLFLPRQVDGAGGGGSGGGADAAVAAAAAAVAAGAGAPAPRWAYAHAALGQAPRWLAVPTHFFKVIVTCGADGRASAAAAFVLPNARVAADARLTDFAVPLSALEAAAGLRFFRDLVGDDAKLALDAAAEPALARNAARLLMAPPQPLFPHAAALALARGAPAAPRHLCSLVECALPAEKFFERSSKGGAASH
jgi:endonuclease G